MAKMVKRLDKRNHWRGGQLSHGDGGGACVIQPAGWSRETWNRGIGQFNCGSGLISKKEPYTGLRRGAGEGV